MVVLKKKCTLLWIFCKEVNKVIPYKHCISVLWFYDENQRQRYSGIFTVVSGEKVIEVNEDVLLVVKLLS